MECVGHDSFKGIVDFPNLLPHAGQVETAVHALDAEMILLIDHQTDLLTLVDGDSAGSFRLSMLSTDQLPLDEKLPINFIQFFDIDVVEPLTNC
jgi:hypothetical protein